MKSLLGLLLVVPLLSEAAIYKCPDANGRVVFSDRPCAGAIASEENRIEVNAAPSADYQRKSESDAASEKSWEEAHRYHLVEVPHLKLQASEFMASGDPEKAALGRELMYQLGRSEEAYEQLKRARAARADTKRRYEDALRRLNN